MDGWKDRTKSGRKENGFENKISRLQSFKKTNCQDGTKTVCLSNLMASFQPIKKTVHLQR